MATFVKFEDAAEEILKGTHQIGTHTFKAYLTNATPSAADDAIKSDLAEITAEHGYSEGGVEITLSISRSGGTAKVTAGDATITASGGTVGPFRYVVLSNDSAASKNLIGYSDYGSSITLQDGEGLNIDFDDSNGLFTLA